MHTALFCALLATVATPPQGDEFTRLGRARADFGDKHNAGKWKFVPRGQFGGTEILFPIGRSDVRYYSTDLCGAGYRLCCETKHGKTIKLEWMIQLVDTKNPTVLRHGGPLWRYGCTGWRLPDPMPTAVRKALESQDPLAAYHFAGVNDSASCCFIFPDGTPSKLEVFDAAESDPLPRTRAPYNVTKEERKAIRALRAGKSKNLRK
jgi:hypothetical protein